MISITYNQEMLSKTRGKNHLTKAFILCSSQKYIIFIYFHDFYIIQTQIQRILGFSKTHSNKDKGKYLQILLVTRFYCK